MTEENYTDAFLGALSEDQLAELTASLSAANDEPESTQRELLARLAAEVERRKRKTDAPPPS